LGFAGKVKGLVRLDVFLDEGDQGADVAVDAWLEAFDFFAGILWFWLVAGVYLRAAVDTAEKKG